MAAVGVTVEFKVVGADYGNVVNKEPFEWDLLQAGDWAPWFGLLGYDTTHLNTQPWYDRAEHYAEEVALLKSLELETDDAVLQGSRLADPGKHWGRSFWRDTLRPHQPQLAQHKDARLRHHPQLLLPPQQLES